MRSLNFVEASLYCICLVGQIGANENNRTVFGAINKDYVGGVTLTQSKL